MVEKNKFTDDQVFDLIYKDELTGLFNRRYYKEQFEKDSSLSVKESKAYTLFMFDIDHFKSINDNYSHQEGDNVLKTVASLLRENIEHKGTPVRLAGDEFIVLLPGILKDEARELGESLRYSVANTPIHIESAKDPIKITLSIGIANYPADTDEFDKLGNIADEAAYISKKKGRNAVSTIDEKRAEELETRSLHKYFPCKTLIGRDELIKELKQLIIPSAEKTKPICVIEGHRGTGKSRLLQELFNNLDPQRFLAFKCQCQISTSTQPFFEIVDTLNRKFAEKPELASTVAGNLSQQKIKEVIPLIPQLTQYYLQSNQTQDLTAEQKRDLLLESLTEIILIINRQKPVVFFIDDFHWSNLGTQMIIERLKSGRHTENIPIFIALDEENLLSRKETDLILYLDELESKKLLKRVIIKPLEHQDAEKMISSIIPGFDEYKEVRNSISIKSRGYPLLIEDILKLLIFKKVIYSQDGKFIVENFNEELIDQKVEETFSTVMISLDEEVRDLLCKASVIGEKFDVELLKKVDGRNEGYVQDLLDKAEKASLIKTDPEGKGGSFTFASGIARDSFYDKIKEDEKKSYHKHIAEIEKEIHKDDIENVLSKISYHFKQSGDIEQSSEYFNKILAGYQSYMSPRSIELYIDKPPEMKNWGEEKELSPENEAIALRILKLIQVTMDNIKKFPLEGEIVRGSFESTYWELKKIFDSIAVLSFTDGDGELLINGKKPIQKSKDRSSEGRFLETLNAAGLKGVIIKSDITKDQFLQFLKMVIFADSNEIAKKGGWSKALIDAGIESVITNEKIYVAMAERDLFDQKRLKEDTITLKKADNELSSEKKTVETQEIPDGDSIEMVKSIYNELTRIKELLSGDLSQEENAGKIKIFLEKIFEKHDVIEKHVQGLKADIKEEEKKAIKQTDSISEKPERDKEVAETKVVQTVKSEIYRKLEIMTVAKLRLDPEVLVRDLESKDDEIADSSAMALAEKGKESFPIIMNYLKTTDNLLGRKRAFRILKQTIKGIDGILIDELMGHTARGEEKRRIIEILHDLTEVDISDCIRCFLRNPQPDVRQAIINLICLRPSEKTTEILLEVLSDPVNDHTLEIIKDVIDTLGRLKIKSSIPILTRLIDKKSIFVHEISIELQVSACLALGKIGDPASVPYLIRALKKSPVYFLFRNKPNKVRAAAAFALSYFQSSDAKSVLLQASRDPMPDVRSAASLAIHNMEKSLPERSQSILGDIEN